MTRVTICDSTGTLCSSTELPRLSSWPSLERIQFAAMAAGRPLHRTGSASKPMRQWSVSGGSVLPASISTRYKPSKFGLNCAVMLWFAASETGISTGTKFLVFVHQCHAEKMPTPKATSTSPAFVVSCTWLDSIAGGPLRKGAKDVGEIVDDVGVRVFLPAAEAWTLEEIPRTALAVDGVNREIQRLVGFAREGF